MGKYEDLNRLQTLRDNGSITQAEFDREKARVLSSTTTKNTTGIYIVCLILGICTILGSWVPILGIILGVVASIVCVVARKKAKVSNSKNGMVTAGIVCTILGVIITVVINAITIGTVLYNGNQKAITSVSSTNSSTKNINDITNMAITCAEDTNENRIISLFGNNDETIQKIKYTEDNGTVIILIKTTKETIYGYKNTTFYGTDGTADISTSGRTSEEVEMIKKGKQIRQWWNNGTELDTNKIVNKLK